MNAAAITAELEAAGKEMRDCCARLDAREAQRNTDAAVALPGMSKGNEMKGARKFAEMFKTGQYGRLYLQSGSHARGKTFHIFVLPPDVVALPNANNAPLNSDAVEVYGITDGQPGWTESYGWLHQGKWVSDFDALVAQRSAELAERKRIDAMTAEEKQVVAKLRTEALLAAYE